MIRTVNSHFLTSKFHFFPSPLLLLLISFSLFQHSCNKEEPIKPGGEASIHVQIGKIQDLPHAQQKGRASLPSRQSLQERAKKQSPKQDVLPIGEFSMQLHSQQQNITTAFQPTQTLKSTAHPSSFS